MGESMNNIIWDLEFMNEQAALNSYGSRQHMPFKGNFP